MKTWGLALLLTLVSASALAAPERVADVLGDMRQHGYASPAAAAARLQTAADAQDTSAPLDQRRRYHAALVALSLPTEDVPLRQQALDALQKMAEQEYCRPCRAQWLLGHAHAEAMAHRMQQAHADLEQAASLAAADDLPLQLQLVLARIRLDRAQGALNAAVPRTIEALRLAKQLGDHATHTEVTILLAVLNAQLGYLDRAEATMHEAVTQARAIGFTAALALARLNQGYIYAQRNQRAEQAQALQQALTIAKSVPGLAYIEVNAHANLSDYYLERGDYAASLQHASKAATLAQTIHDLNGEALAVSNVGIAQARMGRIDEGVASLRRAIELSRQANDLFGEADINDELVKVLQSAQRYQEAFMATQAFDAINEKITLQERDSAVLELQAKYDDERKNREIALLSAQAEITAAEASARRWQQRLWITLAMLAVAAAVLLVSRLARARRANRQLSRDVADLAQQSSLDELTGAFNRRHFANLMRQHESAATRIGLVMLDIDHFKSINDDFGHAIGDGVLKEVVRRLQALGRGSDRVVRWGGEEFVLVLPDAPPRYLPALAARLLDAVASQPIRLGGVHVHATISIGSITYSPATGTHESALRLTDQALYLAKRNGRNRAICILRTADASIHKSSDLDLSACIAEGTISIADIAGPQVVRASRIA